MINSNLIAILRTFSAAEMRKFNDYINSPFFNKNKNVIRLFTIIKKYHPLLNNKKLKKEEVYKKLFPGEKFNDGFLRQLMHHLADSAEGYLAYIYVNQNPYSFNNLIPELINRNLYKEIDKIFIKAKNTFISVKEFDTDYYYNKFITGYENLFYLSHKHLDKYEKYLREMKIEEIFSDLSHFYLIKMMWLYIYILNMKKLFNEEIDTRLFEKIFSNIDHSVFESAPILNIYYNLLMLLKYPEREESFYKAKDLMVKNMDILHRFDKSNICINLENFCRRKIRSGKHQFTGELFDIFKLELDYKMYETHKNLSHLFYKNVVMIGVKLKQYSWVFDFITNYKEKLQKEYRENIFHYCMAIYEFEIKNYEKSLGHLSKVKYDELYLKFDVRILQACLYYEMNLVETLIASIDSFRHNLFNEKLMPPDRKIMYYNFNKYLNKLNNIKLNANNSHLEKIKESISSEEHILYKDWLLEKADEMRKNE